VLKLPLGNLSWIIGTNTGRDDVSKENLLIANSYMDAGAARKGEF
jgi:hypothetical protein